MTSFEDQISLMIPDYLRGRLSAADMKRVEDLAAKKPEIAADLAFQKQLRDSVKASGGNDAGPGDLGWARLSKSMQEDDFHNEPVSHTSPKFWRYAAAVLAVIAVGQAGFMGSLAFKGDKEAQYVTVSETPAANHSVKIAFHDTMTVEEMNQLLIEMDAEIIAGPSTLGLYEIDFTSLESCTEAITHLKSNNEQVKTVSVCN